MGILKLSSIISFLLVSALLFGGAPNMILAHESTLLISGDGGFGISNTTNQFISGGTPAVQDGPPYKLFLPLIGKKLNPDAPPAPSPPPPPLPPPDPLPPPLLATDGNTDTAAVIHGSGSSGKMSIDSKLGDPPGRATLWSPYGLIFDDQPTYVWSEVSNVTWYCLWISDSLSYRWVWVKASEVCDAISGKCSLSLEDILPNGDATWWIRTWNKDGFGPWSSGTNFCVNGRTPGTATQISPSGTTYSSTPTFKWRKAEEAIWYYVWVDDSTTLGSHSGKITGWITANDAGCGFGQSDTCSWPSDISLADGNAKWWIQGCNYAVCGPWRNAMNFKVSAGPQDPILGLWDAGDGGQALMEESTTGGYNFVATITVQGTGWWKQRNILVGDVAWKFNKQPNGHYKGETAVNGNYSYWWPMEVVIQGNQMIDTTGRWIGTKIQ